MDFSRRANFFDQPQQNEGEAYYEPQEQMADPYEQEAAYEENYPQETTEEYIPEEPVVPEEDLKETSRRRRQERQERKERQ